MADVKAQSVYIDTTTAPSAYVNTNSSNLAAAATSQQISDLETALSDSGNGIVARVIHLSGNYVKVKWFKNGKTIGMYKARGHTLAKASEALEYYKDKNLGISAAASLAITGTQSGAAASTSQFTATLTRADSSTSDVSAKAYWQTSDATKATVDATGLVTRVATGSATITATYGGVTNTRSVTIT